VKIGSQVSLRFKIDLSNSPKADVSREKKTTKSTVPQIRTPPMVGVPFFLRCSFWKIVAFSPLDAVSLICFPSLFLYKNLMKYGVSSIAIINATNSEPRIRNS